jgi:pectinesterase
MVSGLIVWIAPNGGWGPAFSEHLANGATCTNLARPGRSSKSYITEDVWDMALAAKGDYYLIRFGHNDQPGKGPERETDPATTYTTNMMRFVNEVRAIGGTPVLVTSLTRRNFTTNNPARIVDTLQPYAEAVRKVAVKMNVPLIDLHNRSIALCEKLGPDGTVPFNPVNKEGLPDTTHLTTAGGKAFAKLVVLPVSPPRRLSVSSTGRHCPTRSSHNPQPHSALSSTHHPALELKARA